MNETVLEHLFYTDCLLGGRITLNAVIPCLKKGNEELMADKIEAMRSGSQQKTI